MANKNQSMLRIGHIKAQSLEPHFVDVRNIIQPKKVHVLVMSESWLKPKRHSKYFAIPGYRLIRRDRIGKQGGGVAVFVHDSVKARVIEQSVQHEPYAKRPEFLFVQLRTESSNILLGVVYSPPKCGYWQEVEEAFINCNTNHDTAVVVGDFNIDWESQSTPRNILRNFLDSYDLKHVPFRHTHHVGISHSTIDYFCISDFTRVSHYHQFYQPCISEHDVLLVDLLFPVVTRRQRQITCRSFRNFDSVRFNRDLACIDWQAITQLHTVDEKVDFFSREILQLYDKHAPYRSFTPRKKSSPWFNANLKQLINERNKAWSRFRRRGRQSDRTEYRRLRNLVKTSSRDAISSYYRGRFEMARDSSVRWKLVDELGLTAGSRDADSLPFDVDELNRFFVVNSQALPLPDSRPTARISPDSCFYFRHVTELDVFEAVSSARSNAQGPDGILVRYLKECLHVILPILQHIFDQSLQSGFFPTSWKRAFVRPIPKVSQPTEISHYRGISILCATSKILEAMAFKQMSTYVEQNNLLDPLQSGFRKQHSTHTALLKVVDDICRYVDEEKVVLAVSIDYTTAFDLVNINLFVQKLRAFGFSDSACDWVQSFLTNRSQVVVSPTGEKSMPIIRSSGVPQGSINGPPFYSLFANDAPDVLRHCDHHTYADDSTIYFAGYFKDLLQIIQCVNEDLNYMNDWSMTNGLRMNSKKTKAMWFGTRNFISRMRQMQIPELQVDGQSIEYCDSIKLLGVTLDSTLSWTPQCNATARKSFAALSRLRKCADCIPHNTKLMLVKSLVFPYFDYCAGLFTSLSDELTLKMRRCKNAALRFATGLRKFDHISPTYIENGILSYGARRDFVCICLLVNILRNTKPGYLAEKFLFRPFDKSGSKRCSELDLIVAWARTDFLRRSFCIAVTQLWNGLPTSLRVLYRSPCFKPRLEEHLLRLGSA